MGHVQLFGVGFEDITPVMENQTDQKMEHEMETGF